MTVLVDGGASQGGIILSDAIDTANYGVCAAVYFVLAVVVASTKAETMKRRHFVVACLSTALWAALAAATSVVAVPAIALDLAEVLRSGGWLYVLLTLWGRMDDRRGVAIWRILVTRAFVPIFGVVVVLSLSTYVAGISAQGSVLALKSLVNIVLPVVGLLLIENVLRISGSAGRWGIKHLCLALGAVMTLDFFIYSDALVQGSIGAAFVTARGLVTTLVAPLIMLSFHRLKNWSPHSEIKIIVSPKAAFYSMALVASGSYLVAMACAAYYIRMVGGRWGEPLQITFLVAAILIMLASLTSSKITAHVKIFITKNFFSNRYNYHDEWLRFIQIMSAQQPSALGLRLARAVADLMDSPASALWVLQSQDECLFADAVWNLAGPHPPIRADSALIQFFRRTCRVVDMDEYRLAPDRYDGLDLPEWIAVRADVWLIIPLVHRGDVLGVVVLNQARAPHRLDWEDRDFLNATAIQAASSLAEELTAEDLRSARRLEDFNRQFAFVVHDIKNVVGQMSLMLENARKLGDNPEFQKDMLETVGNSVSRMRAMLDQLTAQRRQPPQPQRLELAAVLGRLGERWGKTATNLTVDLAPVSVHVVAVEATLISVVDLLIDNALSAVGSSGAVVLRLRVDGERAIIEVADNGPGMDAAFVSKELFRLLTSTKSSGYGIGAYQTRHLVREMGGRLEVETAPQRGTTMRVIMSMALSATHGNTLLKASAG